MYPYLHFGSFSLGTFGILMWLAAVTATYLLHRAFMRGQVSADAVVVVATAMIAGVLGAKLWHELQNPVEFGREMRMIAQPGLSHPIDLLFGFFNGFAPALRGLAACCSGSRRCFGRAGR